MLMPGKATASSRPNLHVLATSAVFNFVVRAALILFVCMQEAWFVMKIYMIFENSFFWFRWTGILTGDTN